MNKKVGIIVYPVKDLSAAKKVFGAFLGVEPYVDSPYYVGYKAGDVEVGLNPNAHHQGVTAPIAYVEVEDIVASLKSMAEAGATILEEAKDVGGGLQVASVKDADGNILGLRQPEKN